MSELLKKIKTDLNQALKKKETVRVSVLRFLLSALHNKEIEKKGELTDEEVVSVIQKQIKLRKEAIENYQKGKRDDLAKKEREEKEILSNYLPQMISSEELEKIISDLIKKTNAKGPQDFGKVMGEVMKQVKGKADGSEVARLVKEKLA